MSRILAVSLPIEWSALGFPPVPGMGGVTLLDGDVGWGWEGTVPDLPITVVEADGGEDVEGWAVDHLVVLIDDVDTVVSVMSDVGLSPRLRMEVQGRPTVFFRAGPLLEAIESPVRQTALFGIALVTDEPLEVVALRWRSLGFDVSDPRPAIQPGRRILTVRGLDAGLAVMSPDAAPTA